MTNSTDPLPAGLQADPVSIRFSGAGSADQKELGSSPFTPDCNGAAGYRYFVEFINFVFSIYEKSTGALVNRVSDTRFWQAAGIAQPLNIVDPRIVFIPDAGRNGQWLAVQVDLGNRVFIATTDPHDPYCDPSLGKWKATAFDLRGNDFPMLGYDQRGVYISVESSEPPTPPSPPSDKRSPQIVFIPRIYALDYPPYVGPEAKVIGPLNYEQYGDSLYPAISSSRAAWPYQTLIGIDNISKRHLTFALFSPESRAVLSHARIEVDAFTPIPRGNFVKQPVSDGISKVYWFNQGIVAAPMSDDYNIWLAHTVVSGGNLAVRWYRLRLDTVTRIPHLAASGEISKLRFDCFNPSILSLGKDDWTVVSFSRSGTVGTSRDPNNGDCGNIGAYAALVREDGSQPLICTLKSGQASDYMNIPSQRWGDYSTICRDPDPKNPRRVWTVNQYVEQGGSSTSQWRNVIAAIDLP